MHAPASARSLPLLSPAPCSYAFISSPVQSPPPPRLIVHVSRICLEAPPLPPSGRIYRDNASLTSEQPSRRLGHWSGMTLEVECSYRVLLRCQARVRIPTLSPPFRGLCVAPRPACVWCEVLPQDVCEPSRHLGPNYHKLNNVFIRRRVSPIPTRPPRPGLWSMAGSSPSTGAANKAGYLNWVISSRWKRSGLGAQGCLCGWALTAAPQRRR